MSISLVKELALRMQDPSKVKEQIFASFKPHRVDSPVPWNSLSLSHGYPGVLLLFATLDQMFPTEGWDQICHNYVLKIKETIETEGINDCSLFGGLAGACFSIEMASRNKSRYQKLLYRLNDYLIQKVEEEFLPVLKEKSTLGIPARAELYDPISGISGIGVYALTFLNCPKMNLLLNNILKSCVALTKKIAIGSHHVFGWYIPHHYQFTHDDQENYPQGNFNIGVAHGASGLLAFLSIAKLRGVLVEGQIEAIKILSDWIVSKKQGDQNQIYWTDRISFEEEVGKHDKISSYVTMDAWCYGTAGVGRALHLAGRALQCPILQNTALEAFLAMSSRMNENPYLNNPTFCHGIAGQLTMTRLMLRDSGQPALDNAVRSLEKKLIALYKPDAPFGFRDQESIVRHQLSINTKIDSNGELQGNPYIDVDKAGLLVGVSGVLLSLLPFHHSKAIWAHPFLIEGDLQ